MIFWAGLGVTVLSSIANPALQALLTRAVAATEQGELQGAMSSLFGVSRLIGPVVFTTTFAWSAPGRARAGASRSCWARRSSWPAWA